MGGFKISFITDNVQGAMVVGLITIAAISIGVKVDIDPALVESSGLLKPTLLGWQLVYILPVAILTNDFFLVGCSLANPSSSPDANSQQSSFWLRTFASKTDKDLWVGISVAVVAILCIVTLVGTTGLIATWAGVYPGDPENPVDGAVAFFALIDLLPAWVVGFVLVMSVTLSTAAFDSFQSAMVSTASNDFFRNRLNIWWIRAGVVIIIVPVVVLAIRAPSILQIYLISDLISAATIPVLVIGLSDKCYWWRGFEVIVGGLGGIFTVFLFGTVYYGNAKDGGKLILLEQGLFQEGWGAFGAFVAAPIGGLLWGFGAFALRLGIQYTVAKVKGRRFDALDRPAPFAIEGGADSAEDTEVVSETPGIGKGTGKFF
jgi:hypothetical protein